MAKISKASLELLNIHKLRAAVMFGVTYDQVNDEQEELAKQTFGEDRHVPDARQIQTVYSAEELDQLRTSLRTDEDGLAAALRNHFYPGEQHG